MQPQRDGGRARGRATSTRGARTGAASWCATSRSRPAPTSARCSTACPATCALPALGLRPRRVDHDPLRRRHRGDRAGPATSTTGPAGTPAGPTRASPSSSSARRDELGPSSSTSAPSSRPRPDGRSVASGGRWTPPAARPARAVCGPRLDAATDWQAAYDAGPAPSRRRPLGERGASGPTSMAEAAWWLGRLDDCIAARERAYRAYDELGDHAAGRAVRGVALRAPRASRPRPAIAGGWLRRARRALDGDPDCVEHGALLLREAESRPRRRRARARRRARPRG